MSLILSGTNGVSDIDGDASTPAIRGTDANTGIFFPAADTIAFGEGGAEVARFDSSGRMLVGTTTSPSAGSVGQYSKVVSSGNTSGATGSGIIALTKGAAATSIVSGDDIGFLTFTDNAGNDFAYIRCQADANAGSNDYPGRLIFATAADGSASVTERARITSGGELAIGSSGGSANGLSVVGAATLCLMKNTTATDGTARTTILFRDNGDNTRGSITVSTSGTVYNTSSDYRLKENIAPMTGALAKVAQLNPVTYTWKETGDAGQGFIAHELQQLFPDAVTGDKDAVEERDGKEFIVPQGIDTSFLVATLTAAIQELKAELDTTKARLAALENK